MCVAQDVLVYLVSDGAVQVCVESVGGVCVQELGRSVRDALNIPDSAQDIFAFWLCSPLLGNTHKHPHTHTVVVLFFSNVLLA